MAIRLNTLGNPSCTFNDHELAELPAQKARFALLTYLAVERNVAREDAAALFWGENGEERARHALSQTLYELRRALGEDWVESQAGRLIVHEDVQCDVVEFLRLVQREEHAAAIALYRGRFLEGFVLPAGGEFECWVERQRAHVERAHRRAHREQVNTLVEAKQLTDALEAARSWVELDAFEDEANHRYIELLAATGKRADALRAYAAYEERLRQELAVEPLDETRALIARIRRESPAAAPAPAIAPSRELRTPLRTPRTRAVLFSIVGIVAFAGAFYFAVGQNPRSRRVEPPPLVENRFAIFPFTYASDVPTRLAEDLLLQDKFSRWRGVFVVEAARLHEELAAYAAPGSRERQQIARNFGAGRFVHGDVALLFDSVRVHAVVYRSSDGQPLKEATVRLPRELVGADSVFGELALALLLPSGRDHAEAMAQTESWPALNEYARGQESLRRWELPTAAEHFAAAARADANFAQAYLWLAQTRSWMRLPNEQWRYAVERARILELKLGPPERELAAALESWDGGDLPAACARYAELTTSQPLYFPGWYGLADCLRRDQTVVADPRSKSGYAFRTSHHAALTAYRRAFELQPSVLVAFRTNGYEQLRGLIRTQYSMLRPGRTAASGTDFLAYPELDADTVAYVPYPVAAFENLAPDVDRLSAAVQQQRRALLEIASAWLSADPQSGDAVEAYQIALELLGDPRSLATLRRARALARDSSERTRLAINEVFVLLKQSAPHDPRAVRKARQLADSLLDSNPPGRADSPMLMASLAVLTGRVALARDYAQDPRAAEQLGVSPVVGPALAPLMVFATIAGPRDSIAHYDRLLDRAMRAGLPPAQMREIQLGWTRRVAYAALPAYRITSLDAADAADPLLHAYALLRQGDRAGVVRLLDNVQKQRVTPAAERTLDVLLPEALLLEAAGQPGLAAAAIDPTLSTISFWPPVWRAQELFEVGAMVRLMVLRADLAHRLRDRQTAAAWARTVSTLWENADPSLAATRQRMKRYL